MQMRWLRTAGDRRKRQKAKPKSAARVRGWKMVSFSEGGCDELSGTVVDGARGVAPERRGLLPAWLCARFAMTIEVDARFATEYGDPRVPR